MAHDGIANSADLSMSAMSDIPVNMNDNSALFEFCIDVTLSLRVGGLEGLIISRHVIVDLAQLAERPLLTISRSTNL
jgi:hypothetical protein